MLKQDETMAFPSLGDSYEVAIFPRVTEGERTAEPREPYLLANSAFRRKIAQMCCLYGPF
jgi:hypothetical protein